MSAFYVMFDDRNVHTSMRSSHVIHASNVTPKTASIELGRALGFMNGIENIRAIRVSDQALGISPFFMYEGHIRRNKKLVGVRFVPSRVVDRLIMREIENGVLDGS